ncbi:uncharacterized protein LOC115461871 [Microcaecilia unicolor]|uniref:Uncharacterized protein LOC115461871 n=1 Tax=Microcaecilia unicolor TaxID=1415580 RepID=A0A6P7X330_9AMPH|nr:uncharacterized protein LOC115461871 [Microcaecilia unicolor]
MVNGEDLGLQQQMPGPEGAVTHPEKRTEVTLEAIWGKLESMDVTLQKSSGDVHTLNNKFEELKMTVESVKRDMLEQVKVVRMDPKEMFAFMTHQFQKQQEMAHKLMEESLAASRAQQQPLLDLFQEFLRAGGRVPGPGESGATFRGEGPAGLMEVLGDPGKTRDTGGHKKTVQRQRALSMKELEQETDFPDEAGEVREQFPSFEREQRADPTLQYAWERVRDGGRGAQGPGFVVDKGLLFREPAGEGMGDVRRQFRKKSKEKPSKTDELLQDSIKQEVQLSTEEKTT